MTYGMKRMFCVIVPGGTKRFYVFGALPLSVSVLISVSVPVFGFIHHLTSLRSIYSSNNTNK